MKVAVYARVSTESEEQLYALDNQIHYYNEEIKRRPDWKLYNMYIDEGITGTSANKRKQFLQMIEDAKEKKFDIIITREVSRFARNIIDVLNYTRQLKAVNVPVFFIMDNINTSDDDGELRLSIMATLAQEESRKLSKRVKEGIKASMQKGNFKSGRPFGYDKNKLEDEYFLVEMEALAVRHIYDMYLNGDGTRKIKYWLEQENILSPRGNRSWHISTIVRILRNKFYAGVYEYYKVFRPDFLTQKLKTNHGEIATINTQGGHQPIVTIEEFETVQEIMKDRTNITENDLQANRGMKRSTHVFSGGRIVCGCCGANFKRNSGRKKKDGTTPYYFICTRRKEEGTTAKRKELKTEDIQGCDNKYILESTVYDIVGQVVKHLWKNKDRELNIMEQMLKSTLEEINYEDLIKKSEKMINNMNNRTEKILDLYLDGTIEKVEYEKKRKEMDMIIETEKKLLKQYECKHQDLTCHMQEFYTLKALFDQQLDFNKPLNDDIVKKIFERIIIYPDKTLEVWFYTGRRFTMPENGSENDINCTQSQRVWHTKNVQCKQLWKHISHENYTINLCI